MQNFKILSPNKEYRTIEMSPELEAHWRVPINHCETILNQINNGTYARWFEGKTDMTVIDFGANVGLTALYFMPACKELLCVEPTPSHLELLRQLITKDISVDFYAHLNEPLCYNAKRLGLNLKIADCALGENVEVVTFCTGHSTENKITSEGGYGDAKIRLQSFPLSIFVNEMNGLVDFVKCDIEGFENKALSIEELMKVKDRVKTFFVEMHPGYGLGFDEIFTELNAKFMQCGYKVERIDFQTIVATW